MGWCSGRRPEQRCCGLRRKCSLPLTEQCRSPGTQRRVSASSHPHLPSPPMGTTPHEGLFLEETTGSSLLWNPVLELTLYQEDSSSKVKLLGKVMTTRPEMRVKNTSLLGPHLKSDQGEHKSQPEDFNSPQVLTQLKLCFNQKQLIKTKIMKILKQLKKKR